MKTKVDERREREEYDRQNPWRALAEAKADGTACELLFSDMETSREVVYILGEDGFWYRIDPPEKLYPPGWTLGRSPMNWRPTIRKLSPRRRAEIVERASKRDW